MLRTFLSSALVTFFAISAPLQVDAVTYKFDFQVTVDALDLSGLNGLVTVDFGNFDFSTDSGDRTSGITGSVGAPYDDLPLGWTYVHHSDALFIGGIPNTVRVPLAGTDDFWLRVSHFNRGSAFVNGGRFTRVGYAGVQSETTQSLSITQLSVIPLPATGWLLIGGLGVLGLIRRRRSLPA
jgi:hypothetical protein